MQLLVIEQIWTQYMWITCRKRPAGWTTSLAVREAPRTSVIRSISNALTGEAVAPVRGTAGGALPVGAMACRTRRT